MEQFYQYGLTHLKQEQDINKSNENWNRRAAEFSMLCGKSDDLYMEFFEEHVKLKDKHILDIGSGAGRYLEKLLKKGAKAEGVEPAEKMRKAAKAYLKKKGYCEEQIIIYGEDFRTFIPSKVYDYLFISNNPMIGFMENYEKIKAMCQKGIFIGSWLEVEEGLLKRLTNDLGQKFKPRIQENLYAWTHLFIHDGYEVDLRVVQKEAVEYTLPEEVQYRYTSWIYGENYSDDCVHKVRAILDSYERHPKGIPQTVHRVNGMLYVYGK